MYIQNILQTAGFFCICKILAMPVHLMALYRKLFPLPVVWEQVTCILPKYVLYNRDYLPFLQCLSLSIVYLFSYAGTGTYICLVSVYFWSLFRDWLQFSPVPVINSSFGLCCWVSVRGLAVLNQMRLIVHCDMGLKTYLGDRVGLGECLNWAWLLRLLADCGSS